MLAAFVAGCAAQTTPERSAETITRAIYANDYDRTVADFDDATKRSVTRGDVGALSDRMHALGDLRSVTERSGDADSGRYRFDAKFTGGAMLVELRVDPSGRIGAYRISPQSLPASPSP